MCDCVQTNEERIVQIEKEVESLKKDIRILELEKQLEKKLETTGGWTNPSIVPLTFGDNQYLNYKIICFH